MAAHSQPGWAHTWGLKNRTCHLFPSCVDEQCLSTKSISTMGSLERFHIATNSVGQLVLSSTALAL